jgi:hypothetical protein
MTPKSFTGDPLIEIARAIGRIEALVGAAIAQQTNHEARIGKLEDDATKAKVYIAIASTIASGLIALAGWLIKNWM